MKTRFAAASIIAGLLLPSAVWASQNSPPPRLPYTAVHDPQFISAADATFMDHDDRVIGVVTGERGKGAKAYPAAILSQHGLVEDRSVNGPIAITW